MERFKEWLAIKVAWMLPRRLVMWCAIRVGAHATTGRYGSQVVPDLSFMDALKRWNEPDSDRSLEGGDGTAPFTRARAEGIGNNGEQLQSVNTKRER